MYCEPPPQVVPRTEDGTRRPPQRRGIAALLKSKCQTTGMEVLRFGPSRMKYGWKRSDRQFGAVVQTRIASAKGAHGCALNEPAYDEAPWGTTPIEFRNLIERWQAKPEIPPSSLHNRVHVFVRGDMDGAAKRPCVISQSLQRENRR